MVNITCKITRKKQYKNFAIAFNVGYGRSLFVSVPR